MFRGIYIYIHMDCETLKTERGNEFPLLKASKLPNRIWVHRDTNINKLYNWYGSSFQL